MWHSSSDLPSTPKKAAPAITCPVPCLRSWMRVPPKETFIARYNMVYYNGDIWSESAVAHRRRADAGRGCDVLGAWPDALVAAAD